MAIVKNYSIRQETLYMQKIKVKLTLTCAAEDKWLPVEPFLGRRARAGGEIPAECDLKRGHKKGQLGRVANWSACPFIHCMSALELR